MKPTLMYAYDPLCGWCFGFHSIVEKLANRFEDDLILKVVPGGLATGKNAQTIEEGYQYIRPSLSQVEELTGVTFGENFKLLLDEGSYFYSSEPSCRAQTVVNELIPKNALDFAGMLHEAIFVDGKNLNEWETFEQLLSEFPVNLEEAKELYQSEEIKEKTEANFEWCTKNGATAFPTLLLQIDDETGILSRGYRPFDILESHLHHLLNNIKKLQD
ncbi:MAG: DsbA family protein [Balneolaceae bacterium]|nr:DsbA family protein [Balneolaceae bacterium]